MPPKKQPVKGRPAGLSDSDDDSDSDGFEFSGEAFRKKRVPYVPPPQTNLGPVVEIDWSGDGRTETWLEDKRIPVGTPGHVLRHTILKKDVDAAIKLYEEIQKKSRNENKVSLNQNLEEGWTPLLTSCRAACPALVKYFIEAGEDVGHSNADGLTCLMAVTDRDNDLAGALECIKLLLAADANINAINAYGQTPLMHAAKEKRIQVVQAFLDGGAMATIDLQDNCGRTALILAAELRFGRVVKLLVERNANLFLLNEDGLSAYDCASIAEHRKLAEVLYLAETTKWRPGLEASLYDEHNFDRPSKYNRFIDPRAVKSKIAELSQIDMTLDLLGLEQYKSTFSAHELQYIDFIRLTNEELIEIGISNPEHMAKILTAIKDIRDREWGDAKTLPVTLHKDITEAESVSMIASMNKYLLQTVEMVEMIHSVLRPEPNLYEAGVEVDSIPDVIYTADYTDSAIGVFREKISQFKKYITEVQRSDQTELERRTDLKKPTIVRKWPRMRWLIIGTIVTFGGVVIARQGKASSPGSSFMSSIIPRLSGRSFQN